MESVTFHRPAAGQIEVQTNPENRAACSGVDDFGRELGLARGQDSAGEDLRAGPDVIRDIRARNDPDIELLRGDGHTRGEEEP